jgi:hypothetical protein
MFCIPQAIGKCPDDVVMQKTFHSNVYWNDKEKMYMIWTQMVQVFSEISYGDTCRVAYILITRNKNIFSKIIHMSMLRKSSLRDYWSLNLVIHASYTVSVRMSQDRFLE